MQFVLWVLALGIAAVALAWWLAGLPGDVTVALAGVSVQTSTPLALTALVLVLLVLLAVLRVLGWIFGTPLRMRRWQAGRRRANGDTAVTRTLVALAAGEPEDSRREAGKARRLLGDTPQTLLLAAEAERLAGNDDRATELFRTLADGDAALLGLRGLFRQALAREDWDDAATLAGRAERVHPGGLWLREERGQLAVRTGDWRLALQLAPPDAPRAAYAVAAADAEADPDEGMRRAKRVWKENPAFTPAALSYAGRLRAVGKEARAQDVLRDAWTQQPQPDLATLALAQVADPMERLKAASRLVSGRPEDPESHMLLASLNLQAGLTGEARRHLDRARAGGLDQRRLWMLMADLEAQDRGETETGRLAQRDALRRAATAAADPAWRCESCGTVHARWLPACPACHTAGRIRWGVAAPMILPPAPPPVALPVRGVSL